MKKIVYFLMFVTIIFIGININGEKEEKIRNVYVDNDSYKDYIIEKYDVLNNDKEIVKIDETISFDDSNINNMDSDNSYLSMRLLIDKKEENMELEYEVFSDNGYYSDFLTIETLIDDEIYLITRYGYITLEELEESLNVDKCKFILKPYGNEFSLYEGGGSSFGAAIGAALTVGAIGIIGGSGSYTKPDPCIPSGGGIPSTTTTGSGSKEEAIERKKVIKEREAAANDFLHNEGEDTGWDTNELVGAFNKACKITKAGALSPLLFKEINNPIIVLGLFVGEESNIELTSYTDIACQSDNNIVFSMESEIWGSYEQNHEGNMWILNKFFLSYWISHDCKFLLVTNPNCFYIQGGVPRPYYHKESNKYLGHFYSLELEYIYQNEYRWDCPYGSNELVNCNIMALRG